MSICRFQFHGQDFTARPSGALYWPAQGALMVADLHLGKSERMARRGGALLPPFESLATLERLDAELAASGAQRLICLGDSFDDDMAREGLGAAEDRLRALCQRHAVIWVAGNHDPAPHGLAGVQVDEMHIAGLYLRHIAGEGPDISGHYHPKFRVLGQRRRAFLLGAQHLILPSFGAYTGGLDHDDPALRALVPEGIAIVTGQRAHAIPFKAALQPQR